MKNALIGFVAFAAMASSLSAHADAPQYGTPAPGTLKCSLSYLVPNPQAPADPRPRCPTCTPAPRQVWVRNINLDSGFTYIYMGAREASVTGSDGQLTLSGSAQVNADGYNTGTLSVRQGSSELVHVMGPLLNGDNLQVTLPVSGARLNGEPAASLMATCWVE